MIMAKIKKYLPKTFLSNKKIMLIWIRPGILQNIILRKIKQSHLINYSKNNLQIRSSGAIYKIGTKDNPHPKYPILARKRGWQGRAVLEVSVDKFGNVSDLSVFKSTGHEILDNVSIDTLKEWKFKPATNNGLPVGDKLKIPIKFILLN